MTIALVSGATATLRRYAHTGAFGQLMVPAAGNLPLVDLGLPWACDNGAFTGFDEARFLAMLARLAGYDGCRWVTAPDVVGDAAATLDLFASWAPRISRLGYPVALVAQDGLAPGDVPWDDVACLFVGGTTAFKLSAEARLLLRAAQARGVGTHVGRVNSARRARYCCSLEVDSFDGTTMSAWPDRWFPHFATLLANPQTGLEIA